MTDTTFVDKQTEVESNWLQDINDAVHQGTGRVALGVADLRTKTPAADQNYYLKYHTSDGDGGHGRFRSVVGATPGTYIDNNGTIIVPTGGDGSAAFLRKIDGFVIPEMFGATGLGVISELTILQNAALAAVSNNVELYIPNKTYGVSSAWNLISNLKVRCDGTIKMLAGGSGGHVVGIYSPTSAISNVEWRGGTIDANNIAGQNALGIGGYFGAVTGCRVSGVTCKNALWDNSIFGGKGFSVQHDCFDIQITDMRVKDCSIGFTTESTNTKSINNIIIDNIIVDNCDKFGYWGVYSYLSGVEDPDQISTQITNVQFNDCADAYSDHGVISLDRMNGLMMDNIFIRSSARVTALRGIAFNSQINFTIDAPSIEDVINLKAHGGTPSGGTSPVASNCVISAKVRASTQIYGSLVTYDTVTPKTPLNCVFDVRYEATAGPATLIASGMASDCTYGLQDVTTGKIIHGSCDNAPSFTSQFYKLFYDTVTITSALLVQDATTETRIQPLKGELKIKDNAGTTVLITDPAGIIVSGTVKIGASGPQVYSGTGSPEGVVTAIVGSIFLRTDGGASSSLYVKESGTGNTGWVAK